MSIVINGEVLLQVSFVWLMMAFPPFCITQQNKALHKAVKVLKKKTDLQCNKINNLEDTFIMYGICNSDTLTELVMA